MAVTTKHSIYAAVFNATALPITRQSIPTGTEVRAEALDGEPYARFVALYGQRPVESFTCYNLTDALTLCGVTGLALTSAAPIHFWAQKHLEGGTRAATLQHRKYTFNEGIVVPRQISCDYGADATLTYDVIVTYDGTNDPIVITDLQTLPAAPDDHRFTLGPVKLGAEVLAEVKHVTIDFGINVVTEGADSDIWPTFASIETVSPVITIRGIDIQWFKSDAVPLIGLLGTHANSAIYFKKRALGGTFVADVTAEHVKVTSASMSWVETAFDGSGAGAGEVTIQSRAYYDATNTPLVVTPASAIT